jgi:hypothetical protein
MPFFTACEGGDEGEDAGDGDGDGDADAGDGDGDADAGDGDGDGDADAGDGDGDADAGDGDGDDDAGTIEDAGTPLCDTVGDVGVDPCTAEEVCLSDGTCGLVCADMDCLSDTGTLCQGDAEDAAFNTCVAVDAAVDSTCGSAALLTSAAPGTDGPVIYGLHLETLDSPADATGIDLSACNTSALVSKVTFSYYDSGSDVDFDGDIADLADFWIANTAPTNDEYYASAAAEFHTDATAMAGQVSLYKCFMGAMAPASVAVVMRDDGADWGNAGCVSEPTD